MTPPELTTEIVGYRQWRVTPDMELRSCGLRSAKWTYGDNAAVCRRMKEGVRYESPYEPHPCGDCPGPDCECGFYALHDPSDLWYGKEGEGLFTYMAAPEADPLLSGIIVAWGAMQVHYQGFRSQHARIAALALPKTKRDQVVARAVASAYGVPCVPSEQLPKIAAEFGSTVPLELRPAKPKPKMDDQIRSLFHRYGLGGSTHWTPSQITWTSHLSPFPVMPSRPVAPAPAPNVSAEARRRMEVIERIKGKGSNRQGPEKPKRAPKRLG